MDLFEILYERDNPGPVGRIVKYENKRKRSLFSAILTGIPSLALVCALPAWLLYSGLQREKLLLFQAGLFLFFEAVYLYFGYKYKPQADTTNLGLGGGLIDHPFRYSDDINRKLVFLFVFLLPGRLLGIGLVDFYQAIRQILRLNEHRL